MASHIATVFNSTVATGSTIYVALSQSEKRIKIPEIEIEFKSGKVRVGEFLEQFTNISWIRIPVRGSHKFERQNTYDYLTVVVGERIPDGDRIGRDSSLKILAQDSKIPANYSYVVTRSEQLRKQKKGDRNLFKDEHDNIH
jgi:hypothetical protein